MDRVLSEAEADGKLELARGSHCPRNLTDSGIHGPQSIEEYLTIGKIRYRKIRMVEHIECFKPQFAAIPLGEGQRPEKSGIYSRQPRSPHGIASQVAKRTVGLQFEGPGVEPPSGIP